MLAVQNNTLFVRADLPMDLEDLLNLIAGNLAPSHIVVGDKVVVSTQKFAGKAFPDFLPFFLHIL